MGEIVDLFAGPGGWSEALHQLGRDADELGIEYDEAACSTRTAAGHRTLCADVSTVDHLTYNGLEGLIASPPCQAFSTAGKGAGRAQLATILDSIRHRRWNDRIDPDPRVWLIVDLGRWLADLDPEWIALEQVPAVLPIWRAYGQLLESRGYHVWSGLLNAADYGVPQIRRRAVLIASRHHPVHPPPPTHSKQATPSLFDQTQTWINMADALGWGMTDRPGYSLAPGTHAGGADSAGVGGSGARRGLHREFDEGRWIVATRGDLGERDDRFDNFDPKEAPSRSITSRSDSWQYRLDRRQTGAPILDPTETPSPTMTTSAIGRGVWTAWAFQRPATTIQGDPRCWPPGHKVNADDRERLGDDEANERYGDRAGSEAIRLTLRDALILQGFRTDYPVQGSRTKQFEQIGNAIPPPLAYHVLRSVIDPARDRQDPPPTLQVRLEDGA